VDTGAIGSVPQTVFAPQPTQLPDSAFDSPTVQLPDSAFDGAAPAIDVQDFVGAPSAPTDQTAPPSDFIGDFGHGLSNAVSDTVGAVTHPLDSIAAGLRGVGQLVSGDGDSMVALRQLMSSVESHPGEALGGLVGSLPLMLIPGGLGAKAVGAAAKAGAAARGAGEVTSALAGAGAGVGTAAAVSTGVAGALANAGGRKLSPDDAKLAAVLGALTGAAVRRGDLTVPAKATLGKLAREYPEFVAGFQSPVVHAERLARSKDAELSGIGKSMADNLKEMSFAKSKVENTVAEKVDALDKHVKATTPEQVDAVNRAIKLTDKNWFDRKKLEKSAPYNKSGPLEMSDSELELEGLDSSGIALYRALIDLGYETQNTAREVAAQRLRDSLGEHATSRERAAVDKQIRELPEPERGLMPHRWTGGGHRVHFLNGNGDLEVRAFDSARKAKAFAAEQGGDAVFLDNPEFTGIDTDSIVSKLRVKDLVDEQGLVDKPRLAKRIQNLRGKSIRRMDGIMGKRKGVVGYDSLDSVDSLLTAMRRDVKTVSEAKYLEPHLNEAKRITRQARHVSPVTSAMLESVIDRASGAKRVSDTVGNIKGGFFHTYLSAFLNTVVPILNFVAAGTLSPVHLLAELRKAGGAGSAADMMDAMQTVARGFKAVMPKRVLNEHLRNTIETNERVGATPSVSSVNLAEPVTAKTTGGSKFRSKLARANSYTLRQSEYLAKRMVGAMFRDIGERRLGLTGHALDKFVHEGTSRTVGEFNAGMRPLFLEGNGTAFWDTLALVTTFQTYVVQKVMADLPLIYHTSKPLAMAYLGSIALAAGAQGIPAVVPFLDFTVKTIDEDGSMTRDWEQYKLDHPNFFRGPLSGLPVDLTGRAGLSGPAGIGSQFGLNPLGVTNPVFQFIGALGDGDPFSKAILRLVPSDARNRYAAVGALKTGIFDQPSGSKFKTAVPVDKTTAMVTAVFGLTPSQVSNTRAVTSAKFKVAETNRNSYASARKQAVNLATEGKLTASRKREISRQIHRIRPSTSLATFWAGVRRTAKQRSEQASPRGTSRSLRRMIGGIHE